MERTKGGYIILDLTMLPLAETEEVTAITNSDVLKQLLSLHEYALKPDRQLKPIYLRAIDSNGVEVVSLCELDRIASSMALRIKALIMDTILSIYVTFAIDGDTQEVYIDSASYENVSEEKYIEKPYESDTKDFSDTWLGGLTSLNPYIRLIKRGNVLYFIVSGTLKNETESDITLAGDKSLFGDIAIPSTIADKLYRKDGSKVSVSYVSSDTVIGVTARISDMEGGSANNVEGNIYSATANTVSMWIKSSITVPAGATRILDFRTFFNL